MNGISTVDQFFIGFVGHREEIRRDTVFVYFVFYMFRDQSHECLIFEVGVVHCVLQFNPQQKHGLASGDRWNVFGDALDAVLLRLVGVQR